MVFIKLKLWQRLKKLECCIFRQVEICIFNILNSKRLKKEKKARNLQQNLTKKCFFLSLHQNTGRRFYSQKKRENLLKLIYFKVKFNFSIKKYSITSIWGAQHPNTGRNIKHLRENLNTLLFRYVC